MASLPSSRRRFLGRLLRSGVAAASLPTAFPLFSCTSPRRAPGDRESDSAPIVDTHMHVWSDAPERFPFAHPYNPGFKPPPIAATAEMLLEEMDELGVTHAVLVQVIYHGWDNRYVAQCLKDNPGRFRVQGLIDPTDPRRAERLEYWVREHRLSGMRFSPIYYRGDGRSDDWLDARGSLALWEKAEELGAIFNFFIATAQLPKLERMVKRFPDVRVVIDHLARIDLGDKDPLPEFQKLLVLSRYPNVWVKVSELSVISPGKQYPYRDTFPWVRRLYDAFGPDRLLWGTGFPGATRAQAGRPSLEEELALIETEIPFLSAEDSERILGRNAFELWEFDEA